MLPAKVLNCHPAGTNKLDDLCKERFAEHVGSWLVLVRYYSVPRSEIARQGNMFESDANILTSDLVNLNVIIIKGSVWNIDVSPDISVDKLKTMALCHYISLLECVKETSNYKLVLLSERSLLDNDSSVLQERFGDNKRFLNKLKCIC